MNKEIRNLIIAVVAIVAVIGGGWAVISTSSGVSPPFTVVESYSMQHCQENDKHSEVGVIDTGDMILVKNKDKVKIQSYVEGTQTGYKSFGDYGNVIVYYRDGQNPVIHRAFLWLDFNGDGTWSAPALQKYKGEWDCEGGKDVNCLFGTLSFKGVGNVYHQKDGSIGKNVSINLDTLAQQHPHSGFLTLGDSVRNYNFDQTSSIAQDGLISMDKIKSVAWKEIPWLGAIKLTLKGNEYLKEWASNSVTMLVLLFISIILLVLSAGQILDQYQMYKIRCRGKNSDD